MECTVEIEFEWCELNWRERESALCNILINSSFSDWFSLDLLILSLSHWPVDPPAPISIDGRGGLWPHLNATL